MPLGLFRNRDFTLVNVETFLVYGALAGSMFFLGLFLQSVIGYTPFEAGLLLLPSTVVLLVLAPRFGRLADRYGPDRSSSVGRCSWPRACCSGSVWTIEASGTDSFPDSCCTASGSRWSSPRSQQPP